MRIPKTRLDRMIAGALLLATIATGIGLFFSRERSGSTEEYADAALTAIGNNRYLGPDNLTVEVPDAWRIERGTSEILWAILKPRDSRSRLPQIGVGSISTNGLSGTDALDTLDEILNEIMPELSSESSEELGVRITTGNGIIGDAEIAQVRVMRILNDRVVVAWGLFTTPSEGGMEIVRRVAESFEVA